MKIDARNITKTYNHDKKSLDVLKDVDFGIAEPGLVAILGPSGAGKTTLLNILSGLDVPTRGRVFIDDTNIHEIKEDARQRFMNRSIGFVFQSYNLLDDLNAAENIALPALLHRQLTAAQAKERALHLLRDMGLENRGGHYPTQLSGGEKQRVAIARALINDPPYIFCDEPTGNLDSATGLYICKYLRKLSKQNHKTVLIVTHDDTIARMSDRIFYLKDGKEVAYHYVNESLS